MRETTIDVTPDLWEEAGAQRAELLQVAAREREASPASRLGTQSAGWNSRKKSPEEWDSKAVTELVDFVSDCLLEIVPQSRVWEFELWFNVLPPGGTVALHDHHQADWVAVHYVKAGDDSPLSFPDIEHEVETEDGLCVFFPGDLNHELSEYLGGEERISIAINATERHQHGMVRPRQEAE